MKAIYRSTSPVNTVEKRNHTCNIKTFKRANPKQSWIRRALPGKQGPLKIRKSDCERHTMTRWKKKATWPS